MHYINIIDYAYPDEIFMFMSARVNVLNIQRNNDWTLCKINDNELTTDELSGYISDYIWEVILPKKCMLFLNRCENICMENKRDILSRTMNVASYMKNNTTDIVKKELSQYLNEGNTFLTVDGFLIFRLKGLIDDLKALLNVSIYENYIEDEYNDFIHFMKEIVAEQISVYDEIFLFEVKNGFKILAEDGVDITENCVNMKFKLTHKNNCEHLDSIISSVISLAPKKIYIHCSDETFESAFCDLIRGIFSGKVIKC